MHIQGKYAIDLAEARSVVAEHGWGRIVTLGAEAGIKPRMELACVITRADGSKETVKLLCRIDTLDEVEYFRHGGILQYVLRGLLKEAA